MISVLDTTNLPLTEKDFQRISEVIYQHCGINLHDGKMSLVRARLAKRMRLYKYNSFTEYIDFALSEAGRTEFYSLVDSISTNLTSFFREKVHFDYIREHFIPTLIESKAGKGAHTLRAWSAGCSSGEEPYSLAITLTECLESKGHWDIKILASDVSTRILERAQAGTYDKDRIAPLNGAQKSRFFVPNRMEGVKVYQVKQSLQKIIRFRYLNLMENWPFTGPFDIIMCRNVMIYFDKATQEKLVNRFWNCQDKGGLLCIGHSESLTGINHKYGYIQPATYIKS
ncbi:MAG: protein-glutamate O-methyltransferase [Sedimentisphaerales bacterium]|nr:protein-glutamate O-methyltransferase [Sedimentisphaerales bacterium]